MWFLLAVAGHGLKVLGFLGDKLFIEKLLPNPRALAFLSGIGGAFFFVFMPWFLHPVSFPILVAALASGAISIPSLVYFYRAVDRDEISRVVPTIGSMVPIATLLLAYWLLGERFSSQTLVAILFLIVGGTLVAVHSFVTVWRSGGVRFLFFELWIAFLFALSAVFMKYAFEGTSDINAFLWSRIGSVAAACFLLYDPEIQYRLKISRFREKKARPEVFYLFTKLVSGLAPLLLWAAIAYGSVTLVNALQGVQFPILFLLAVLLSRRWPEIFQEELRAGTILQKSLATICIGIGLVLLIF